MEFPHFFKPKTTDAPPQAASAATTHSATADTDSATADTNSATADTNSATADTDAATTGTDAATAGTSGKFSALKKMTKDLLKDKKSSANEALNSQVVQAVQLSNSETAAYAASQIAIAPNLMMTQASGLIAQAGAVYFDSTSKMALASKSMLLKNMTEKLAREDIKGAAEDALGILLNDLLVGTAAAVAAASGALEAESASFALDKIDSSIAKYKENFC